MRLYLCTFIILSIIPFHTAIAGTIVKLTNNTSQTINTIIVSDGPKDLYTPLESVVTPLRTEKILNLSRYSNIEANREYWVYLFLGENFYGLKIHLQGSVWGSSMSYNLFDPNGSDGLSVSDRDIHHVSDGGFNYYLKAVYTGGYDDLHIVVDDIESKIPATVDDGLRMMTYNTWMLPYIGQERDTRARYIAEAVKGYDVVFLQEVFDLGNEDTINFLMSEEYVYRSEKLTANDSNTFDGGVLTYSKYPIEFQDQLVFEHCIGTDCSGDKGAVYTKINHSGKAYHLFNIHLGAWNGDQHRQTRMAQLGELRVFISAQQIAEHEPVIVGGDFNIDREHYSEDFQQMLRILDAYDPGESSPFRYSSDPYLNHFSLNNDSTAIDRERLDYVLLLKSTSPKRYINSVLPRRVFTSELWGKWELSDHFAVEALIEIE